MEKIKKKSMYIHLTKSLSVQFSSVGLNWHNIGHQLYFYKIKFKYNLKKHREYFNFSLTQSLFIFGKTTPVYSP